MIISRGELKHLSQVHSLINELAVFEKEPNAVINSIQSLEEDFRGKLYDFFVVLDNNDVVGFALYYMRYSTWKGKSFYLEDFYIQPQFRNNGIGKELFSKCVVEARAIGCYQMNWQVLDWNKGAIRFYERIGANISTEWHNGTLIL